ncbi:ankyrin repeat domain-containing protein [Lysobacter sp. S4-A87]|uniref:ankyrin repeat domain-containing protein n=1 Tax=Lysobacter sp. S4-A87 TaxID=2925843 RepID=UPI001F52F8A6|nr:ankyrin repeat domain-containing protein [Lysobacter sp. S4-A87]UNK49120.1 ankyrin repeat domain-containing protein [Lysobacter sp. S4-A87]
MRTYHCSHVFLGLLLALATGGACAQPGKSGDAQALQATQLRTQLQGYFFDAARSGHQSMLDEFIAAGFDLDVRDEKGYTALILAAYHGHAAAVEQLLAAGADPCAQDKRGNTALMGAIFKGELSIARRLLRAECAPDQRNNAGQTAAMYAALFRRKDVLEALGAKGADMRAEDAAGNSPERLANGEFGAFPATSAGRGNER